MSTRKKYNIQDFERRYGRLTFAKFLISWRKSEDLSQVKFAEKLGISKANLCDLEKGRKGVSPERAAEIARKLGLPPAGLIQLALQDMLDDLGLDYEVEVEAA